MAFYFRPRHNELMLTDRHIYPMHGFGELEFFMTVPEVTELLGVPSQTEKNEDLFYLFYHDQGIAAVFTEENDYCLSSIILEPKSDATFVFTDLFKLTPDLLTFLIKRLNHILEKDTLQPHQNIYISPSLGLTFYFDQTNALESVWFNAPDEPALGT